MSVKEIMLFLENNTWKIGKTTYRSKIRRRVVSIGYNVVLFYNDTYNPYTRQTKVVPFEKLNNEALREEVGVC